MNRKADRAGNYARIALAGIRLFNGIAALCVPAALARRLGVDPETNRAALYVLRLFGVRTILIGAQLLLRDEGLRAHSVRVAPVIHALDAAAALIAGDRGHLPRRTATTAAIISTVNTGLAVVAQKRGAEITRSISKMKGCG
jgi:hypothetical protein